MKKLESNTTATKYNFSEANMNNGVIVMKNMADLEAYINRPVSEKPVFFTTDGIDRLECEKHKAILVGNDLVAVQKNSYKLISNKEVIMPVMDELSKLNTEWKIDKRHSFMSPTKMRVNIQFPGMSFSDAESKSDVCLSVTNSYDGSNKVQFIWGALRLICTNGMTMFEQVGESISAKHTCNFDISRLQHDIDKVYNRIPLIQERINLLSASEFKMTDEIADKIEADFGKRAMGFINQEKPDISTYWAMYNALTMYVSHYINIKQRLIYQQRIAEMFKV